MRLWGPCFEVPLAMLHPWNTGVWQSLLGSLDRLPHAILLSGPRGIGKLALARHLSQRLLCEAAAPSAESCGACEGCRWFVAETHPDFRLLQPDALSVQGASSGTENDEDKPAGAQKRAKPSTEIKIEQVRGLSDFLNIGSHRARRRTVLVHPAEAMNPNAANSLLKALEEPPPGAAFILVSHNASRLLPTLRSRCVTIKLRVPEPKVGVAWLTAQGAAQAERWLKFYGGAPLLARERLEADRPNGLIALLGASVESRSRFLGAIREREEIGLLVDALQKLALDRALVSAGQPAKYLQMQRGQGSVEETKHWVGVARRLGRYRPIVDHPLNQSLLINQILNELVSVNE